MKGFTQVIAVGCLLNAVSAFTGPFVPKSSAAGISVPKTESSSTTTLKMVDSNVIQGAGIAFAGLAAGIGMVAFTEKQGERAKERGSGISDSMNTKLSGMLMEDVEVSSVEDIGSLTNQLEQALKATGGTNDEDLELSEEEKKRIAEEADDGW